MCRKKLFEYVEFHDVLKDPQSREYVDFLNNYGNNKSSWNKPKDLRKFANFSIRVKHKIRLECMIYQMKHWKNYLCNVLSGELHV